MGEPQMMLERELVHEDKKLKLMIGSEIHTPDDLDAADHQNYLSEQTRAASERALESYNEDMDASYLLDVPLNSNGCFRMGEDVIHVNFTAKNGSAGISEHFFAELTYNHPFKSWWVNDCVAFNPDDETNISKGCTMCSYNFRIPILHPAGHYALGQYDEDHYIFDDCDPANSDEAF
ncbi:hypothetical protein LINPERHAP2_LOCUS5487 [Linum perenne]